MIRWFNFINYPEDSPWEEAERWYLGSHTQEAKHQIGLRKYVTYKPLDWPAELPPLTPRWKQPDWVTELHYNDVPAWYHGAIEKMPDYTPPPGGFDFYRNFVSIITSDTPDYEWIPKWLDKEPDFDPDQNMVRALWLLDLNIGPDVMLHEAESWYLDTHTREVAEFQSPFGLRRYITFRGLEHPDQPETTRFRWLTELWFPDLAHLTRASLASGPNFTPPPGGYDTLANWQMTLVSRVPDYDLLKEVPKLP